MPEEQENGSNEQFEEKQQGSKAPQEQNNGKTQDSSEQPKKGNGLPEWISFFFGLAIVVTLVVLLTVLHFSGSEGQPQIRVTPRMEQVAEVEGKYYLAVEVKNEGGSTAEDVNVQMELQPPQGQPETVTFTIRFLAPGEDATPTLIFQNDPNNGTLNQVISFKTP